MPLLLIYAHLGYVKAWSYRFIWAKPGTLGACLGGKRPENCRNATEFGLARPNLNLSEALVWPRGPSFLRHLDQEPN
jgi:hypothetical protein